MGSTPIFEGWCVGDGDPSGSKDTRPFNVVETTEAPGNGHPGIWASLSKNVVGSRIKLKYIYTNAHSMGNKQEKLGAIVQQKNYDIVAIVGWLE